MAVAFQPLDGLTNVNLVRLWLDFFKDRFERAEERPPYQPPIERFDSRRPGGLSFEATSGPPPMRLWMVSTGDRDLLQLQGNWFARNWRKIGEGDEYPRYEPTIRPVFESELRVLAEGLEKVGVGEIQPTQCEITYINHIQQGGLWEHHGEADKVFRDLAPPPGVARESVAIRFSHLIRNESGETVGRLHARIDSAFNQATNAPIFTYNLTARGQPLSERSIDGVLAFMDLGRESIVRLFAATTTGLAHEIWRRRDTDTER